MHSEEKFNSHLAAIPQMAVQRCQQSFGRADLQMLPQKHKPKLKQSQKRDAEQRAGPTGDDEVLTDGELQSVMINWAINDFQPTGPQGFAPKADGKLNDEMRGFFYHVVSSILGQLLLHKMQN